MNIDLIVRRPFSDLVDGDVVIFEQHRRIFRKMNDPDFAGKLVSESGLDPVAIYLNGMTKDARVVKSFKAHVSYGGFYAISGIYSVIRRDDRHVGLCMICAINGLHYGVFYGEGGKCDCVKIENGEMPVWCYDVSLIVPLRDNAMELIRLLRSGGSIQQTRITMPQSSPIATRDGSYLSADGRFISGAYRVVCLRPDGTQLTLLALVRSHDGCLSIVFGTEGPFVLPVKTSDVFPSGMSILLGSELVTIWRFELVWGDDWNFDSPVSETAVR